MNRIVAVLFLSAAILLPTVTHAFTLYTDGYDNQEIRCTIVNVGSIDLRVRIEFYDDSGIPNDPEAPWVDLPAGQRNDGMFGGMRFTRCAFFVRAKNPRKTATVKMVRATARFTSDGEFITSEAR